MTWFSPDESLMRNIGFAHIGYCPHRPRILKKHVTDLGSFFDKKYKMFSKELPKKFQEEYNKIKSVLQARIKTKC